MARMFARSGVDLLRTAQREQHDREVSIALANTDLDAVTADQPRNWRARALAETQRLHAELFADRDEREAASDVYSLAQHTDRERPAYWRRLADEAAEHAARMGWVSDEEAQRVMLLTSREVGEARRLLEELEDG